MGLPVAVDENYCDMWVSHTVTDGDVEVMWLTEHGGMPDDD